ncbi:MAG: TonB-dependent receptor [Pseudomonadota bacterium]
MRYSLRGALCVSTVLVSVAAATSAFAQDTGAVSELEEIVVTARKTSESLIDVPMAVTAISAAQIEERGIADVQDIASFTPGFKQQAQSVGRNDRGFKQYVIRGIVPNSALATRQAATLFVDGAPVSGGNVAGIGEIERVETVKGPQSAFFGRSTFAGAINLVTRRPSFSWGGKVSAEVASYGTHDINGMIEGPLVEDKVSFRLSARDYSTDGAYGNVGNPGDRLGERSTQSLAATLYVEPFEGLDAQLFVVGWKDSDGPAANGQFNSADYNCVTPVTSYICGGVGMPRNATRFHQTYIEPTAYDAVTGGKTLHGRGFINHLGLEREAWQARLLVNYELPGGYELSGTLSQSDNTWAFLVNPALKDTRNIPNPNYIPGTGRVPYWYSMALGNTRDQDTSGEIRITSPQEGRFRWLAGINYTDARTDNLTAVFGNTGYFLATPQTINSSKTLGYFGSVAFDFTEQLTLSVEGRYQSDELYQTTRAGTFPEYSETFDSFTPRVILEYKPVEDITIYGSYSEGRRPGEFNTIYFAQTPDVQEQISAQANVDGVVPEDELTMVEFGVKGRFLDNRLQLMAAAYAGKWTNRHIPNYVYFFLPGNPQQQSIQVTSANGEVDLKGFELEGSALLMDGLTMDFTFAYNDTEIVETFCTDCLLTSGDASPTGTQLPFYPKYSGTLSAQYERDILDDKKGFVRVDYIYTGKQFDTEANLAWTNESHVVNLRAGIEFDAYRVEVFATNILDEDAPTSLARSTEPVNNRQAITVSLPEPTIVGMRLAASF